MVAVLLLILKIIGISLLVLLGLVVVLLLLVLFYPLRYRLTGEIPDMESRKISLKVHWMLFIARFSMVLDEMNELQMCLRIFGIPVWRRPEIARRSRKRNRRNSSPVYAPFEEEAKETDMEYDMQVQELDDRLPQTEAKDEQNKSSWIHTVKYRLQEIWNRIRALWQCIRALPERIRTFRNNLHKKSKNLGTILKDENNRQVFGLVWTEFVSLLKQYGPKQVCADVDFGTNDPALTGQILAVLSMMPFLFEGDISIRPDFESEQIYAKGTFDIRGRIQVCHIFGSLFRLYKDEKIKKLFVTVQNRSNHLLMRP